MAIQVSSLYQGALRVNEDFMRLLESNGLIEPDDFWKIEDEPVKKILAHRGTGRFFFKVTHRRSSRVLH